MDPDTSRSGTPVGGPLQTLTHDRVNQQRESVSSIQDKISQFNGLSSNMTIAMQSKQLERKAADAALKRAMLGREEAEMELRRHRDENKLLRKALEEGKERERRVGERLEAVMESYGRAKETHAHTQALWEKEIRRARKETFKTQSSTVKLQEELKSARGTTKTLEENIEREKERSRVREQEAFTARYQIVGVQEQLDQALAQIKVVEQERDAFKTAAKNEEVARIAAEGRLPLPRTDDPNDEFASPPKKSMALKKRKISEQVSRYSLSTFEIESSEASELEIEELNQQVAWERQRADRAQDMVEFLKAECEMHCCPCNKSKSPRRLPQLPYQLEERHVDFAEPAVESYTPQEEPMEEPEMQEPEYQEVEMQYQHSEPNLPQAQFAEPELAPPKSKQGPRLSTLFYPKEGVFRTVSEQEAQALATGGDVEVIIDHLPESDREAAEAEYRNNSRMYARTPSVEPPAFAIMAAERTSLMSLLDAPQGSDHHVSVETTSRLPDCVHHVDTTYNEQQESEDAHQSISPKVSPHLRSYTSAALYTITTSVPIRDENQRSSSTFSEKLRTPSHGSNCSFDTSNPALTPTMTREEALAKIRERRGRARSAAQSAATPAGKMIRGKEVRNMSAPTSKVGSKSRS